MNHDGNVVRVVERRRGAVERGITELPPRRGDLPNELPEIVPVFVVAERAAFRRKIILIPPLVLGFWRQRRLVGFRAADQIAANGNEGLAALRPERRDDVRRPCSPVIAGEDRLVDLEGIHQSDGIEGDRRLLTIAERCI
jgi:hypothetical protein